MKCQLIVIGGPDAGRTFPVEDGQTLVIGRGQSSDTQINDPRMSRVHCRFLMDNGKAILLNVDSSKPTLVEGESIDRRELQPGDKFQAGDTLMRYVLGDDGDATTMAGEHFLQRSKPQPGTTPLPELVGRKLAYYHLDAMIAQGASGAVFKATDTEHDRVAAVKVLTPDPAHSEEQKDRFVRAMKTMLPVRHPHLVQLYNAGKSGPYCWAAMEYIDGESMTEVIARIGVEGMLDWREAHRVAVHVGRALQEAYEREIIHRNVTPRNILRRHSDRVCLLGDLILAKALHGTLAHPLTQPGQIVGDVAYMSPERTRGPEGVDHRSDIYGLGATLYALLTGQAPFRSPSLPDLVRKVRSELPRKPREFQMSINDLFQDAVLKMLAKQPEDRYAKPADLLNDLDRIARYNNIEVD